MEETWNNLPNICISYLINFCNNFNWKFIRFWTTWRVGHFGRLVRVFMNFQQYTICTSNYKLKGVIGEADNARKQLFRIKIKLTCLNLFFPTLWWMGGPCLDCGHSHSYSTTSHHNTRLILFLPKSCKYISRIYPLWSYQLQMQLEERNY